MKKIVFLIAMLIIVSVSCGKESKKTGDAQIKATSENAAEVMTYDEIINLPIHHRHVDNNYYSISEWEEKCKEDPDFEWYCPMMIKVKEVHYKLHWVNDEGFYRYPNIIGGTSYIFEVVKIAEGYEGKIKEGDLIETGGGYSLLPVDKDLYDLISEKTGKEVNDLEDLKKIDSFSFEFEPVKGKNYIQEVEDDDYLLKVNELYTCICNKNSKWETCGSMYCYPVENQEEFIKILNEKYRDVVQGYYLKNCKEVNEMFR